jgi:hypothetical protein
MAVAQKMFIRKGAIRPQTYRTIPTVMLTWHHKHHRSNDSEVRTIILKRAFSSKTFSLVLFICQVQRCASMPMYFLALFLFIVLRLYWFSLVFYARFQRERMQQKKGWLQVKVDWEQLQYFRYCDSNISLRITKHGQHTYISLSISVLRWDHIHRKVFTKTDRILGLLKEAAILDY